MVRAACTLYIMLPAFQNARDMLLDKNAMIRRMRYQTERTHRPLEKSNAKISRLVHRASLDATYTPCWWHKGGTLPIH